MKNCKDCGASFTPQHGNHFVCAPCIARKAKEMSARLAEDAPFNALLFQRVADNATEKTKTHSDE